MSTGWAIVLGVGIGWVTGGLILVCFGMCVSARRADDALQNWEDARLRQLDQFRGRWMWE